MTWQPIEKAPKDIWILVWQKYAMFPYFAHWEHENEWWEDECGFERNPTHWIALPPTPEDTP